MSRLNGKGPEDDGITMGRGLGNCFEKRKQTRHDNGSTPATPAVSKELVGA